MASCVSALAQEQIRYFGQTEKSYHSQIPYGNNAKAGKYVDVGDTKIYYEVYGQGDPVVVLHGGLVGSPAEMAEFIDRLSSDYTVVVVSTRGHGKSGIGSVVPGYMQKAQDVYKVLNEVTNKPARLVGFSDGAYIAYHFAAQYPEKTVKVVAIGAGEWKKGFRDFTKLGVSFADFEKLDLMYWKQQKNIRPEPERIDEWYREAIEYYKQVTVDEHVFGNIQAPVLVLAGEHDANAPLDTVLRAYHLLPNAQLAIVANASHPVFLANFPAVWANVEPFLAE